MVAQIGTAAGKFGPEVYEISKGNYLYVKDLGKVTGTAGNMLSTGLFFIESGKVFYKMKRYLVDNGEPPTTKEIMDALEKAPTVGTFVTLGKIVKTDRAFRAGFTFGLSEAIPAFSQGRYLDALMDLGTLGLNDILGP
jgi:hypothetical protein